MSEFGSALMLRRRFGSLTATTGRTNANAELFRLLKKIIIEESQSARKTVLFIDFNNCEENYYTGHKTLRTPFDHFIDDWRVVPHFRYLREIGKNVFCYSKLTALSNDVCKERTRELCKVL